MRVFSADSNIEAQISRCVYVLDCNTEGIRIKKSQKIEKTPEILKQGRRLLGAVNPKENIDQT